MNRKRSSRPSTTSNPSRRVAKAPASRWSPDVCVRSGQVRRGDVSSGKVIVTKDKRITAKHIRELANAGIDTVNVGDDFLLGRVLATNVVSPGRRSWLPVPTTRSPRTPRQVLRRRHDPGHHPT